MPAGTSCAPFAADEDEFSDSNFDWEAVGSLADTAQQVHAAAERQQKINDLVDEAETELKEIGRLRKGGSGHPGKTGRKGTENFKLWTDKLAHLKNGLLPGESVGAGARSDKQLHAAAQQHAGDHAAAGNTTRYHHAQLRAQLWPDLCARGGGDAADVQPTSRGLCARLLRLLAAATSQRSRSC